MTIRRNPSLILISILALIPMIGSGQTTETALRSAWDRTEQAWASSVLAAALSSEGRCVAISTPTFVAVADKSARELWRWNFSAGNRFIVASRIAVAPKCDWLAFAGSVDYRYVWIVHRSGKRISLKTEGTPLSVEISHSGTLVAVGTGAGMISLYNADGTLRWKKNTGISPVQQLSFAGSDDAIMLQSRGQAVYSIAGRTEWEGGVWGVGSARAARDFKAFVAWGEPPHGPGIGSVAMLDGTGKELWRRYATYPVSAISSKGDLVLARTNDNQSPTEEDHFSPGREELTSALRLFAADGSVVRTFTTQGEPVSFADDGRRFLIRTGRDFVALDLEGTSLWNIPMKDRYGDTVMTTSDLQNIVILSNGNVSWFSAP